MNCIIIDDDLIIQKQLSAFIGKSDLLNLKGIYSNPIEAFDRIKENNIDLVFLDIEMPEMSGLEYLEECQSNFQIIVVSGDRKYALDTFEFGITDYLLKPIEYSRFVKAVNKSIERNIETSTEIVNDSIFVKVNSKYYRIKIADIMLVKLFKDEKVIVTRNRTFNLLNNFFNIDMLLQNKGFLEIDETHIVNLKQLQTVTDGELIFHSDFYLDKIIVNKNLESKILKSINL